MQNQRYPYLECDSRLCAVHYGVTVHGVTFDLGPVKVVLDLPDLLHWLIELHETVTFTLTW